MGGSTTLPQGSIMGKSLRQSSSSESSTGSRSKARKRAKKSVKKKRKIKVRNLATRVADRHGARDLHTTIAVLEKMLERITCNAKPLSRAAARGHEDCYG